MSTRHTRRPCPGIGWHDAREGLAFVPSMGWVGSIMPGGRHHITAVTWWQWFGTGRMTGMGTEICTPVRMNGIPR